jgi:hypothetical protein
MVPPPARVKRDRESTRMLKNTMPHGQIPLVDRLQPQRIWSNPTGNEHALCRDLFHRGRSFLREHRPSVEETDGISRGVAHVYIPPGGRVANFCKGWLATYRSQLPEPALFPQRIEIEFSLAPAALLRAEGLPGDYVKPVIDWALGFCPAVALCVDWAPGTAAGEAHAILGELQATFRCHERHASVWEAFLRKRLRSRHRFAVVHSAAGSA